MIPYGIFLLVEDIGGTYQNHDHTKLSKFDFSSIFEVIDIT